MINWIVLTLEDQLFAQEGLGLLVGRCLGRNAPMGLLSPDETRSLIRRVRELAPGRPFGISTTLLMPVTANNAELDLEEEVTLISISLGTGEWMAEAARSYG